MIDDAICTARPSRYEGHQGVNPIALALVLLITASLLVGLMVYRGAPATKHVEARIEVVNLSLALPPPPPEPEKAIPPPDAPPPPPTAAYAPPPRLIIPATAPPQIEAQPLPIPPVPFKSVEPGAPMPPAPAPAPAPARSITAGDLSATMVHAPSPRYPRESRRLREQGTVLLSLVLATDGTVAEISVAKGSGYGRLDNAALAAVRNWRWRPTMRQGNAVQVRGSVEIPFVLTG